MKFLTHVLFLGILVGISSCGGDSGSGVPPSTLVSNLTPDQIIKVCDAVSEAQGGYGRRVVCTDGHTEITDTSRASCQSKVPALGSHCPTVTVGDVEGCANAIGRDLCKLETEPACANVRACIAS